jgi:hypothetical protein
MLVMHKFPLLDCLNVSLNEYHDQFICLTVLFGDPKTPLSCDKNLGRVFLLTFMFIYKKAIARKLRLTASTLSNFFVRLIKINDAINSYYVMHG